MLCRAGTSSVPESLKAPWRAKRALPPEASEPSESNVLKRAISVGSILGAMIVYVYTVIAYALFKDDMVLDNYPDDDIPMCTDLVVCYLNTFNVSGSPNVMIFCECTSTLRVGAGRMLEVIS